MSTSSSDITRVYSVEPPREGRSWGDRKEPDDE